MTGSKIDVAADALATAWREGTLITIPSDSVSPSSLDEGTRIQDALAERLGFECVGWKLGISSPAAQETAGVDEPMTGRLFRQFMYEGGTRFAADQFRSPLLEAEFAFRVARDLPPRATAYSDEEILEAVEQAVMGIEIVGSRYDATPPVPAPLLAADNGATGGYVVGPDVPNWRALDLAEVEVSIDINGARSAESLTGAARCQPVPVLLWSVAALGKRGIGLKSGDIVTTGTACAPIPCGSGSDIVAHFDGLGEVRMEISD